MSVDAVTVKVPPFWKDDPVLWFSTLDAQFGRLKIKEEQTKFWHVVGALTKDVAIKARDVINNPPAVTPFQTLKERLIREFGQTDDQRANKLFDFQPLGDQKPSDVLYSTLENAPPKESAREWLVKQVFLRKMPEQVRLVMSNVPFDESKPSDFANQADTVWSQVTSAAVASTSPPDTDIEATSELKKAKKSKDGLCRLHRKWGKAAWRCLSPCRWPKNGESDRPQK